MKAISLATSLLVLLILAVASPAYGVMPWISPTGIGGVEIETGFSRDLRELKFDIGNSTSPYSSNIAFGRYDCITSPVAVKISLRPELGYSPYCRVGVLRTSFLIDVLDGSEYVTESLTGGYNGFVLGGGIRYVLGGDSVQMEQFFLDLGINYYYSALDKYIFTSGAEQPVNQSLGIWEAQGSLLLSRAFEIGVNSYVSPYGGLSIFQNYSTWRFIDAGAYLSGSSGNVLIIAGLEVSVKQVGIKIEAGMLGGFSIAGGINLEIGN